MSISISPRDILLTKPIIDAIKSINPSVSLKGMKIDSASHGFSLSRLAENQALGTDAIPAITVKEVNQKGKTYYSIIDGRHRSAIAIANGLESIPAIVQSGGKTRKRKHRVKKTRRNSHVKYQR
jgi:hypothetical protein